MSEIEARLRALGLTLPELPKPIATYVPFVRTGNLLFLSGQTPRRPEGGYFSGTVGGDVGLEAAQAHARHVGLQLIAVLQQATGDLDRVARIVKLFGMVNATPGFRDQAKVINGCSDLLVEVFGERGWHARSAVGMGSLPHDCTVEIELIAEIS
ncbi:RidA family protein [Acidocella sp.]|jgi:enamine deaminase RidA (YjgF/YER057c/UK114 family)|uniref:RidA family protein n=1 Tax=Acidocella sp. TaxID=50710 RepID=UPI002F41F5DB